MSHNSNKSGRIYICHTFYHVYIASVRELLLKHEQNSPADIMLSTMSNDFGKIAERFNKVGLFRNVISFDEKRDDELPEVIKYKVASGGFIAKLLRRIKYTRELGKAQEKYVPVDLSKYEEVYVFCDSDPIGYYLNYKRIPYYALEDGLNCGRLDNQARNSNPGMFGFKCLLAKTGLIFIECGYSRYCKKYIVNDISQNQDPPSNIEEWPCAEMYSKLTREDHLKLIDIFLDNPKDLLELFDPNETKPYAMILTEPLCALDVRKKIFKDIVKEYEKENAVIIKPHPRDELDYVREFPEAIVIRQSFPMEIMNDIPDLSIGKVISVITQIDNISFAKEKIYLGLDFLDKYEDPSVHRKFGQQNEGT